MWKVGVGKKGWMDCEMKFLGVCALSLFFAMVWMGLF